MCIRDSHNTKRNQVSHGSASIIAPQTRIPKIGTTGTNGVRNPRGASGIRLRMMSTPTLTRIKASRVPMLVISPTTLPGTKAANAPTKSMKNMLLLNGVRYLG